jgi:hypothetical protein
MAFYYTPKIFYPKYTKQHFYRSNTSVAYLGFGLFGRCLHCAGRFVGRYCGRWHAGYCCRKSRLIEIYDGSGVSLRAYFVRHCWSRPYLRVIRLILCHLLCRGKCKVNALLKNWTLVYVGNLLGRCLWPMCWHTVPVFSRQNLGTTPFMKIADVKTTAPFYKVFVKGIGANWLVALAVWLGVCCAGY